MRDPEFRAEAARQQLIINPVSGDAISALLQRVYALPRDLLDRVAEVSAKG